LGAGFTNSQKLFFYSFIVFSIKIYIIKRFFDNYKKGQSKKIFVLLPYSVLLPERFFLKN